jgi:hypothetical protein
MGDPVPPWVEHRLCLPVGGEDFFVDTTPDTDSEPLPVRAPTLRRRGDRCLVLSPSRRWYLLVLVVALSVAVGYFVLEKVVRSGEAGWLFLLLFPLKAVMMYLDWLRTCYRQSVVFDRGAGRVYLYFGRGTSDMPLDEPSDMPLDTIAAVQLVPFAAGEPGGQLHLVLTDMSLLRTSARALPRHRITQGRRLDKLRDLGCRLATFLRVPMLEQSLTAEGPAAK